MSAFERCLPDLSPKRLAEIKAWHAKRDGESAWGVPNDPIHAGSPSYTRDLLAHVERLERHVRMLGGDPELLQKWGF